MKGIASGNPVMKSVYKVFAKVPSTSARGHSRPHLSASLAVSFHRLLDPLFSGCLQA